MNPLVDLQKQIAYTLIAKVQNGEITTDRATEIARKVEILLPDFLTKKELEEASAYIIKIPELSSIKLNINE